MEVPDERADCAAEGMSGGSELETLITSLRLGLTSFGGPITHVGYFRPEYVERRRWLDETSFADLVALRQYLPAATGQRPDRYHPS